MDAGDKEKLQKLILEDILSLKDKVFEKTISVDVALEALDFLTSTLNEIDEQFGTSITQIVEGKYSELYKIVKQEG